MATRNTVATPQPNNHAGVRMFTWSGLLNGDDGEPVEVPSFPDTAVQFSGTFGSGGNIVLEGSLDGSTYFTLSDPQGNAISKGAAAMEQIQELVRFIKPRVTGGDGTTNLTARLIARKSV